MMTSVRLLAAFAVLLGLFGPAAAQAPASAPGDQSLLTKYLLSRLRPGISREHFVGRLRNSFALADGNQDGEANAVDIETHKAMGSMNELSLGFVLTLFRADLNDDGVVTEEELRRRLAYDQRINQRGVNTAMLDQEIRKMMAADTDGDGKISMSEVRAHANNLPTQPGRPAQRAPQSPALEAITLLQEMLAITGKSSVTLKDLENLAVPFFAAVDTDRNDILSKQEIDAYRAGVR